MLNGTLEAFTQVIVPQELRVEMIVVDNGSMDDTAEIVRRARHLLMEILLVHKSCPGKSRALNAAVAAA